MILIQAWFVVILIFDRSAIMRPALSK